MMQKLILKLVRVIVKIKTAIHDIVWFFTWRRKLCHHCTHVVCIGNYSPCFSCHRGENFEEFYVKGFKK